jgi:hypothetical protein
MRKHFLKAPLLFLMLLAFTVRALAAEVTLVPTLAVRAEMDDNVLFSRVAPISDYVGVATPGVSADYRTERGYANAKVEADFLRYAQEQSLDRSNQRIAAGFGYAVTELLQASGRAAYINDTSLETQLQETGIVTLRQEVERYSLGAGLTYRLSPRTDAGMDLSYQSVNYDGPSLDYEDYRLSFQYNYLLGNGTSVFTVQPSYERYTSEASDVSNYGLSFGLAHALTETWSVKAFLGVRYTQTDYRFVQQEVVFDPSLLPSFPFRTVFREVNVTDSNWAGVADVSVRKTGEIYQFSLGYIHDLSYSSSGDPLELHRVYGSYSRSITTRLGFTLAASVYESKSDGQFSQTDSRYFDGAFTLNYKLTEDYFLQGGYRYQVSWDDTLEQNQRVDRHLFFVSLGLAFPRKW